MTENNIVASFLYNSLVDEMRLDVIDLLAKAERGELKGKKILIKKRNFHSSSAIHQSIIEFLERKGVGVQDMRR